MYLSILRGTAICMQLLLPLGYRWYHKPFSIFNFFNMLKHNCSSGYGYEVQNTSTDRICTWTYMCTSSDMHPTLFILWWVIACFFVWLGHVVSVEYIPLTDPLETADGSRSPFPRSFSFMKWLLSTTLVLSLLRGWTRSLLRCSNMQWQLPQLSLYEYYSHQILK